MACSTGTDRLVLVRRHAECSRRATGEPQLIRAGLAADTAVMGSWGSGICDNDTASDVRDRWRALVAAGTASAVATRRVLDELAGDREGASDVWLALADTQARHGMLEDAVRDRALAIVESGSEVERWAELGASPADQRRRARALASLRERLLAPPRRARRPRASQPSTDFAAGDVFSVMTAGRLLVFRVLAVLHDTTPVLGLLEYDGDGPPTAEEAAGLQLRPATPPRPGVWRLLLLRVGRNDERIERSRVTMVARGLPAMPEEAGIRTWSGRTAFTGPAYQTRWLRFDETLAAILASAP